jgi:protein disulfide-isomerase A6
LPNIYDSNAAERNAYLETVMAVAKRNRKHPFVFFWLQAGDQMDMENKLHLGFGFPAVVAISPNKQKLSIMKGAFNEDKLATFLSDLISGRASLDDLKTKPEFKKADLWDGKDAAPIEEVIILLFSLIENNTINFRNH